MKRQLRSISIGLICLMFVSSTGATIRVVAYNCANRPNNTTQEDHFRTVFQAIGNESVNGIAKRLDMLYGLPMAVIYAKRDWEHAVGAHYMINFIPWIMVFLEN